MARGERFQLVGTDQSLGKGPEASPSANPRSGKFQLVGDSKSMSPTPVHSPSANPRGGQSQLVGDSASMSRSAVKGWGNAANLTMSRAAVAQSDNVGQRGSKKR